VRLAIPEAIGEGKDGFLTLQDRPLIAVLVNAVKEIASLSATFKNALIAWFADTTNGITDFFTRVGHFERVCAKNANGSETCVDGDQLKSLLIASAAGAVTVDQDAGAPGGLAW
jgi:hypothetical protein